MKKKLLSILLALTMLATLLTACGSNDSSAVSAASSGSGNTQTATEAPKEVSAVETPAAETPASAAEESTQESVFEIPEVSYPLTDTPESFSLWYSFPGDLSDIMDAYLTGGQSSVLKAVTEKTGVSLTFMLQSVTTASDNFNLLVASGDYPDLFYNASSYYTGGIDKAVEDEVLVDVTELVPEYAPNYYYNITKDPDTLSEVSTPSGRLVEIQRLEAEYTKSSTGNTEKLALVFQDILTQYHWASDLIHLDEDTDLPGHGIYLDQYDLVLLGSPVISGSPSPLVSRHLALVDVDPPRLYSNQLIFPGSLFQPERAPLGIVFATYSGETFGPSEALPALELESMYLKYLFLNVIGKFACPGRKAPKSTIELLASELELSPDEVAQRIGKYERNPDDPIFSGLSEDALALLHQAVMDQKNGGAIPVPEEFSQEVWHRDLDSRPHSRDLQKARIFLEEILEDYFTSEGLPKQPGSVYTCIG